jgi:signal transduction histidine kinase
LAERLESNFEMKDLLLKASELAEKTGNYKEALNYRKQYEVLNDTIVGEKSKANINLLEAKFETEKKESRITQLEAEKQIQHLRLRQKSILNYALIGASLALLLLSYLVYRNYRHKQALQQRRITELEREKQLTATEAVLKGEEQERTRLAKDLHDGLGGMLSGIKYAFQNMKENLIMTPENLQSFERSMDMLDSSIKEMRRVAHNMMPESLVKFGLDTALKDFCTEIGSSGAVQINYQSIGLNQGQLEKTAAIAVYRIVQELIGNILKHASAKNALVQVAKNNGHLTITVEDDGKGFDTTQLQTAKGIGWNNIQNRVDFLKGSLTIDSIPEKGTSVHIEFEV